ncbi:hypothetical protein AU476_15325 [Cupriavidus sp. UYMSc13B]|nr:hypothetical protein AU476_15325 [Cupriavidus sp. UYMSc13B]
MNPIIDLMIRLRSCSTMLSRYLICRIGMGVSHSAFRAWSAARFVSLFSTVTVSGSPLFAIACSKKRRAETLWRRARSRNLAVSPYNSYIFTHQRLGDVDNSEWAVVSFASTSRR